jgi:predicted ester cyclase
VVTCLSSRGTHRGELWGIAPTGREAEVSSVSTNRIEGGKIVEHWTCADRLGMMQQLGVIEQPSG